MARNDGIENMRLLPPQINGETKGYLANNVGKFSSLYSGEKVGFLLHMTFKNKHQMVGKPKNERQNYKSNRKKNQRVSSHRLAN